MKSDSGKMIGRLTNLARCHCRWATNLGVFQGDLGFEICPKSDALRGCYCKAEAKAKRKLAARQKAKAKPKELLRDKLKSSNLLGVERS